MLSVTKQVTLYAKTKEQAIEAIQSQAARIVDLDYPDGGADAIELGRLGRKFYVGVSFRFQESIVVKNIEALRTGLERDKTSFRQRFICCDFNIKAKDIKEAQALASKWGDIILPEGMHPNSTLIWE